MGYSSVQEFVISQPFSNILKMKVYGVKDFRIKMFYFLFSITYQFSYKAHFLLYYLHEFYFN